MSDATLQSLFRSVVTRDISPVVYFHEQSPEKVEKEVSEYIVTGGWPATDPRHQRVPNGIHEQYVHLLHGILRELDKTEGPELPTSWISGFYGSGKSSFAKLLGLSLDGLELPSGKSLAEVWLNRDSSPKAQELKAAWAALRQKIEPIAVVFDIGSVARDNEHLHATALREVQKRLGYCSSEPLVADFELKLERDGMWKAFEQKAEELLGKPWKQLKDRQFAEEDFSLVLSGLFPEHYNDPMAWITSRAGTHQRAESPQEAVKAMGDMIKHRQPNATLFLVVDEVSQYVLNNRDRTDRLRAFASALGASLRGKAWLLALGQQKLDEAAGDTFLSWAKDRFPPQLRVHLAPTNIRDVVHRRLLEKTPDGAAQLRELFARYRADLKLYAYGCEETTEEEFVDVYPLLPGQIELILQITTVLRTRSSRAQGDDQAIRGLLQLLGELFRSQNLAEQPIGTLVSLDMIYEVQNTALDADTQQSMARILAHCTGENSALMLRAAKAVALLELIQDTIPTDDTLVARCLANRIDAGNQLPEVSRALETLRRSNLLGYSDKQGYKIQSTAGEEWSRERDEIHTPRSEISRQIQEGLKVLMAEAKLPRLKGRDFRWAARFSDGRQVDDASLLDPREDASITIDCRFLTQEERVEAVWVRRSGDDPALQQRLIWIAGNNESLEEVARNLHHSEVMVGKYIPRRESLNAARQRLLLDEQGRVDELQRSLRSAIAEAWLDGSLFFQGRPLKPRDQGTTFTAALLAAGTLALPQLYQHFDPSRVQPAELKQLLQPELSGPSPKFMANGDGIGILELDGSRYVPACSGLIPQRVLSAIENDSGLSGAELLRQLGSPPYGYAPDLVMACVAGLLRGGKVRIQPETGGEITAVRDAGVQDLFELVRAFKRARLLKADGDDVGPQARARICKFFEDVLRKPLEREDGAIADAVADLFPKVAKTLREVQASLDRLPIDYKEPEALTKLGEALERCTANTRRTKPTVLAVKRQLDVLRDGVLLMQRYHSDLQDTTIAALRHAHEVVTYQAAQVEALGVSASNVEAAATRVREHLAGQEPWQALSTLDDDLTEISNAYRIERQRLIEAQELQVEACRQKVRGCSGYSTLTNDQAHKVLKPLTNCATATDQDAVAPTLVDLKDPFVIQLQRAEKQAIDALDGILSEQGGPVIRQVDLKLQNRELRTREDVQALVAEIEQRLLQQIEDGAQIRLI